MFSLKIKIMNRIYIEIAIKPPLDNLIINEKSLIKNNGESKIIVIKERYCIENIFHSILSIGA